MIRSFTLLIIETSQFVEYVGSLIYHVFSGAEAITAERWRTTPARRTGTWRYGKSRN